MQGRDSEGYKKYLAQKKLQTKMRQTEHEKRIKEDELKEKMRKLPLDYRYYSTEDEEVSDYELDDSDIHPRNGRR